MKERFKYIPSIVMLLAGFIACIVTIVCKYEILEALTVILVTLIIFYIIGIVIKALFNRFLINDELADEDGEALPEEEAAGENPDEAKDGEKSPEEEKQE